MVILVVVINTLISFALLYVAWRVWKLKQQLRIITDRLSYYESCSHTLLYAAPEKISSAQQSIYNLRQGNQRLEVQIQQIRQIISLLFLGRQMWQRSFANKLVPLRKNGRN
ncbi:hypothetical protein NIES2100_67570 [Calothrix sp. NIES-2100]|uniref:hypothetical protein n=1 Tax=Calothrix sp. NIES-2100 TaxID=1954172 RepID=UPI000B61018A|nr:hypothetical protein NIES2100_67570 [Calothrix sp. NIES-2100]